MHTGKALEQPSLIHRTAKHNAHRNCLGHRPYDPVNQTYGPYRWMDYATVQKRRAHLGVGIVQVNERAGVGGEKYGVGLWCQNRPEWQLTGRATIASDGDVHC